LKVDPWPSSLSTRMDPPLCFTTPNTVASQAGASPRALGGEEGLEEVLARLLVRSGARVRHGDLDAFARAGFGVLPAVRLVQVDPPRLDDQLSAVRHRVASVDGKAGASAGRLARLPF